MLQNVFIFINMDMDYVKMWVKSLVREEINKDQLKSVADTTGKSEAFLRHWIERTDPTPNQGFAVWLLRGLKKQWIRMEDGERCREALERFILLRRQNRIVDIMRFPQINDLEDEIARISGNAEKGEKISGLDPTTLPGVSVLEKRPEQNITFYKVTNAASVAKMGEGTKWCTRHSYDGTDVIAKGYITRQGYLVIGYKDGKPFIQYNPDYSQVMDVNDVNFRYNKNMNPKDLELPAPSFLKKPLPKHPKPPQTIKKIRPVEPKRSETDDPATPQQRQLANWMPFTHKHNPDWTDWIKPRVKGARTMSTSGQDLDYEKRLAASLLKTTNHEFFSRMLRGFAQYAESELGPGHRSEIVEKALLHKNFADIQQNFGYTAKGSKGKKIREKRAGINGLEYIARYVMNNIQGHWPEFEKKLENDPYNSMAYYNYTGLNPDFVTHPLTKDVILISKMIKNGHPSVSTKEFNATLKDFFTRTHAQWKHANFSTVVQNVLQPFLKKTKQSVQDVLGDELAQRVARSFFVGRGTEYWKKKPTKDDPTLPAQYYGGDID